MKTFNRIFFKNLKSGFTIVEIMVATGILGIAIIAISNFFTHGAKQTDALINKGQNLMYSRLILQHLEQDIRETVEITQFEDNEEFTSFVLKKVKSLDAMIGGGEPEFRYVIYTLYKRPQIASNTSIENFSLYREDSENEPPQGMTATARRLMMTQVRNDLDVGLIPSHQIELPDGTQTELQTQFTAYDDRYDAGFLHDDHSDSEIDEMLAMATYMGVTESGTLVGFASPKEIVGIQFEFLIGDIHGNRDYFKSLLFMRPGFYTLNRRSN